MGVLVIGANSQTVQCPAGMVCLTRATAEAYLKLDDENKGLKQENAAVKAENATLKDSYAKAITALHDSEIDAATAHGQLTEIKSQQIRYDAIMDVLIKNSRLKKVGINIF